MPAFDLTGALAELRLSDNKLWTEHQGHPVWTQFPLNSLRGRYVSPITGRISLGKGGFGEVSLMKSICPMSPGTLVAVKSLYRRKKETVEDYFDRVFWEFTLGLSLVHENINQTISIHYRSKVLHQVVKYCSQGSLMKVLCNDSPSKPALDSWAKQLLRGTEFLHARGIAHRDIKPENLLLGDDGFIKIIDFGLAHIFEGQHPGLAPNQKAPSGSLHTHAGTQPYQPPEYFTQGSNFDYTKQDVWSCGVTLLAFARQGKAPWGVAVPRLDKTYRRVDEGWTRFLKQRKIEAYEVDVFYHPYCGPIFEKLPTRPQECCLLKMLHPQPMERISIHEALKDHWIKGIPDHRPGRRKKVIERRRR